MHLITFLGGFGFLPVLINFLKGVFLPKELAKLLKLLLYAFLSLLSLYFINQYNVDLRIDSYLNLPFLGDIPITLSQLDLFSLFFFVFYIFVEELLSDVGLEESKLPIVSIFSIVLLVDNLLIQLWFVEISYLVFFRDTNNHFSIFDFLTTAFLTGFSLIGILNLNTEVYLLNPSLICLFAFSAFKILGLDKVKRKKNSFLLLLMLATFLIGTIQIESFSFLLITLLLAIGLLFIRVIPIEGFVFSSLILVAGYIVTPDPVFLIFMLALFSLLVGKRYFSEPVNYKELILSRFYWLAFLGVPAGAGVLIMRELNEYVDSLSPSILSVIGLSLFVLYSRAINSLGRLKFDKAKAENKLVLIKKAIFTPLLFLIFNWIL